MGYITLKSKETQTGPEYDLALEKVLIKTMIIAILIVSAVVIYAKWTYEPEKFTSLYLLGQNGKAENYPTDVIIGEKSKILVGIENFEYAPVNYTLLVKLGGITLSQEDTITQDGFAIMLRGFQKTPGWTSQVTISVKNIDNQDRPFNLNPSPVLVDDLGNQYGMVRIERGNQIIQTNIYPGAIRRGTIFFEPINPDAKSLKLIIYLNEEKYEYSFEAENTIR